jgi:transcriptional repressor NrdR
MKCPSCSFENTKVVDSRVSESGTSIRRRRECEQCSFRFTTFEKSQTNSLMVHKKDGSTEPYDREKLERAIMIACGKRRVSLAKVREKLSELEERWTAKKEIKAEEIGEDVVEMLRDLDEIAFIRFASVYKQFKDVETFKKELEKIL